MPTNDERREVAARLREVAPTYESRHNPDWSSSLCSIAGSPGEIFTRLADLIEPEERTCEKAALWDAIVRCRDCKYATLKSGFRECEAHGLIMVPARNFCSWGERRNA